MARANGNKKRIRIIILWCLGVGKNEVLVTVILDVLLVVGNYKKITITQEWRNVTQRCVHQNDFKHE